MESFLTEYKKLNSEQRDAVNQIDGPVLVIAGPGTGKTQLLSARVANILSKTDTSPSSILCLTFTNSAATNMRDRLYKLIGPTSRNVTVKTFHSFAAELMNMYPDYFWNGAKLKTAPDTVQLEVIQDILSSLDADNPLATKFDKKFTAIPDIINSLNLAKEAGLTPKKLEAIIQANIEYIDEIEPAIVEYTDSALSIKKLNILKENIDSLPDQNIDDTIFPLISLSTIIKESLSISIEKDLETNKTINTGVWKKKWVQSVNKKRAMYDERKRNIWWLELSKLYEQYRTQLHSKLYYDYSDMLVEVISQLEKNADFLANVQERFIYVLIDEFQDTNAAQLRLARLVSEHSSANKKPNLMVVGDDDQSIYKFNGAELDNMLSFKRQYPETKLFVLNKNYRSSQEIINTSNKIIEQANDRLVNRDDSIFKNLIAEKNFDKSTIKHLIYKTNEDQYLQVSKLIKNSYTNNKKIAVISRNHDGLQLIASKLISLGVPVRYDKKSNIFDQEVIQQIILLTKICLNIQTGANHLVNYQINTLLRHPLWNIDPKYLWKIALRKPKSWLEELQNDNDIKIKQIGDWLFWLSNEVSYQPLTVSFEYIIGLRKTDQFESPIRKYFQTKKGNTDYLHSISAIRILRSEINEFSNTDNPTIDNFIKFVDLNIENNKIIADESPFVSGEKSVELLTVHKSKGLEFDEVYIIDAIEKNWQPRQGGRKPPANLPLQKVGDDNDDYTRLMYVAATRAKNNLFVSSYGLNDKNDIVLATPLIRDSIDNFEKIFNTEQGDVIEAIEDSMSWPRLKAVDEKAMLKSKLENYNLSVTSLLNFLDITSGGPKHFLEKNLLQLPEAKTPALAHGTSVHEALEVAQKLINTDKFSIDELISVYKNKLKTEGLPKYDSEKYFKQGEKLIHKLFNELEYVIPKGSLPEQNIKDIRLNQAVISGKIDRIDQLKDGINIVDYKTGKPLNSFDTKNQTQTIKAWKQKTQLVFYDILIKNSSRFNAQKNIIGQMVYVEAETKDQLTLEHIASKEEVNNLILLIEAVWNKIQNLDFPDIAKYEQNIEGIKNFERDLIEGNA